MRYVHFSSSVLTACSLSVCALLMSGCGSSDFKPKLAPVTGVVTLNDKPLPDVTVTFEPQRSAGTSKDAALVGSNSTAVTDASGKYELVYNDGMSKGAVVGSHIVRIASASGGGPAGGADAVASIPIPSTYNTNSTLKSEVKSEPNTLDFKLIGKPGR